MASWRPSACATLIACLLAALAAASADARPRAQRCAGGFDHHGRATSHHPYWRNVNVVGMSCKQAGQIVQQYLTITHANPPQGDVRVGAYTCEMQIGGEPPQQQVICWHRPYGRPLSDVTLAGS